MKDDEKRGETPRFLLCFAFLHASTSILRGFYDKDSLPGDCHVALLLAMTLSTSYGKPNITFVEMRAYS